MPGIICPSKITSEVDYAMILVCVYVLTLYTYVYIHTLVGGAGVFDGKKDAVFPK